MDYLKVACRDFTDSRNVLQLDEIHVRSDYCYKGGKLFGSSFMKRIQQIQIVFPYLIQLKLVQLFKLQAFLQSGQKL